jgi:hypothetical protein
VFLRLAYLGVANALALVRRGTAGASSTLTNNAPDLSRLPVVAVILGRSKRVTDAGSNVLVGGTDGCLTASGLWPSDHAGLIATLRLGVQPQG